MTIRDLGSVDSPLFDGLSAQELEQFEIAATPLDLDTGDVLFLEGEAGDSLCVVRSGLLGIFLDTLDGEPTQVNTRGPGSVIGEYAVLTGEARSATVKALTPTKLLSIPGDSFMSIARGSNTLLMNINNILSRRLQDANRTIVRRKGQVIVLVGDLPRPLSQWMSQNLAVAIRVVGGKQTIHIESYPVDQGTTRLPNSIPIETFLDGIKDIPESEPGAKPIEKVLSIEPNKSVLDSKDVLELTPFLRTLEETGAFADHIVLNLGSSPPGSLAPLLSSVMPDLFKRITKIVWVAEGVNVLADRSRYARKTIEGLGLDYDLVSWMVFHDGPKPNQAAKSEWQQSLGGEVIGVLPKDLLSRPKGFTSRWADGPIWDTLVESARAICNRKLGVALGGGGAKGFAHIGIISAFEEMGLSVDYVAGTSAGSIIGALWALGRTPDELAKDSQEMRSFWRTVRIFQPQLPLPIKSLLSGNGLRSLIKSQVGDKTFDDTFVPFAAVAAHLMSNRPVIFDSGPILTALVASSSMPMFFPPVKLRGRVLVDGGQIEPVPVPTVKLMGADQVIAIRLSAIGYETNRDHFHSTHSELEKSSVEEPVPSWVSAYINVFDSLRHEIANNAVRTADICLQPSFQFSTWNEVGKMDEFMQAGYTTVYESETELKRILPWLGRRGAAKD